MKLFAFAAGLVALVGVAEAATVNIQNADFEGGPDELAMEGPFVDWEFGIDGWNVEGNAGVFDTDREFASIFNEMDDSVNDRVAFLGRGSSVWTDLGVTIETGFDYTLSALFGNRNDMPAAGRFGFYAGSPDNMIEWQPIAAFEDGTWSLQAITLDAATLANFIGQTLGVIFYSSAQQLVLDNVNFYSDFDEAFNQSPDPDVVPVPGALPLMATALFGGFLARRRAKKATA